MTDDLDEIKWGPKTPYIAGVTVLDLSQPLKLWWADGYIYMITANVWDTQPRPHCTHYAYPEAPPMTEAVGYWGPGGYGCVGDYVCGDTHRVTITFPADDMPEFDLPIPGGGRVKMERVG